ncbi:hypothetical protein TNCT_324651, partial [Trichonephila clavata]
HTPVFFRFSFSKPSFKIHPR